MDPESPFAGMTKPSPSKTGKIHVLYCENCHYVWKAPAETTKCVNCKGYGENTVRSLVSYRSGIPII